MTTETEKNFIDALFEARENLLRAERHFDLAKQNKDAATSHLTKVEADILDWMRLNGVTTTEAFYIKTSERIAVDDVEALPEEYVRVKKEPNKVLIKKHMPKANWYRVEKSESLGVKEQKI